MKPAATLQTLLSQGVNFAPQYRPVANSDHLPMTLCAMAALGATDADLLAFRAGYVPRLHVSAPGPSVDHWQAGTGRLDTYPSLVSYFRDRLARDGVDSVLDEVLPVFLPAVAADAFHPMIRLGYAIQFKSRDETAAALAYMTVVHREVPCSSEWIDLGQVLENQSAGGLSLRSSRFDAAILELVASSRYPIGSAPDFRTLAQVSLALYQSTRNFFALHLVTATQALRCAVPAQHQPLAVASMTGALLASHLVLGAPGTTAEPLSAPTSLDPEHAYKYVWACLSEYREYGDDKYLVEARAFREGALVPSWVAIP